MKITLKEWLGFEALAKQASMTLEKLSTRVTDSMLHHNEQGNVAETKLLADIDARINEAKGTLASYLFHVQSEWTGGDSNNPKNFTLREPNLVTVSHSFPRDQVEEFRTSNGDVYLPSRHTERWGATSWQVGDVQTLFDVTDEDARKFLHTHDSALSSCVVDRGWDFIRDAGVAAGWGLKEDQEEAPEETTA